MQGHRTAERRSVAYHGAIAERIAAEPELVERAKARLDEWEVAGTTHPRWIARWREVLALPVQDLARALVSESETMIALRQATPFAGALDARTRWKLWRENP